MSTIVISGEGCGHTSPNRSRLIFRGLRPGQMIDARAALIRFVDCWRVHTVIDDLIGTVRAHCPPPLIRRCASSRQSYSLLLLLLQLTRVASRRSRRD